MRAVISLKSAIGVSAVALLAACGGGGGGGGSSDGPTDFTSISSLPEEGVVLIQGQATSGSYSYDQDTGALSFYDDQTGDASIKLVIDGSNSEMQISSDGSKFALKASQSDISYIDDQMIEATKDQNRTQMAFMSNDERLGYEYQSFGVWLTGYNTGRGTFGVGSFGNVTPEGKLPIERGTASYEGGSIGLANEEGTHYLTSSDISVTTDFEYVAIESKNTVGIDIDNKNSADLSSLDFTADAVVDFDDSKFKGTAVTEGNFRHGSEKQGEISGKFYGPRGEEIGGTFDFEGSFVDESSRYIGSFGAAR